VKPRYTTAHLARHPDSRDEGLHGISVSVCRMPGDMLSLRYVLSGDIERVRIPDASRSARAERLWQHTCCEAFVRVPNVAAYHELNFSPSGEWAAYSFSSYRENGSAAGGALDPNVEVCVTRETLTLEATVRLQPLDARYAGRVTIGLSAVIEARDGSLSYWALAHAAGKPDFHHDRAFALELP
jgi:hypothetical protein